MKAHDSGVGKIDFLETDEERIFVSGGLKDGKINIFDLRQEKIIYSKRIGGGSINAIKKNKSDMLVMGCSDKSLTLFDLKTFKFE